MAARTADRDRLAELLAGEAVGDLSQPERAELEQLLGAAPATRRDEFMRVAALTQLAVARPAVLPAALRAGLQRRAQAWSRAREQSHPPPDEPR